MSLEWRRAATEGVQVITERLDAMVMLKRAKAVLSSHGAY